MRPQELFPLSPHGRSSFSTSSHRDPRLTEHKTDTSVSCQESEHKASPGPPSTFGERWRRFWERPLLNTWLTEALALTFSAACLLAIVVVLKVYEKRSVPQIPFGLTLNAIVSILATASKSSLLLAVAAAISQLKWCWFTNKRRRLEDIQEFDDASRGPWGSVSLLFSINFRSLASLGALITLLTLAYDPFVQQILKYPVRETQQRSDETMAGKALVFTPDTTTPEFGNALNAGIWSDETAFARQPSCPTGNCNWPAFESVGWCSKCENVTSRIVLDDCPFEKYFDGNVSSLHCNLTLDRSSGVRFAWPKATSKSEGENSTSSTHDLNILSQVSWLVRSSNNDTGPAFLGVDNPALVFGFASLWYLGDGRPWPEYKVHATVHHAEQCVLTPCARTYNITTRNGATQAEVINENYGVSRIYNVPAVSNVHSPFQTTELFCWQPGEGNLTWHYIEDNKLEGPQYGYTNPWLPPMAERWDNISRSGFCSLTEYQEKVVAALTGTAKMDAYDDIPGSGQSTLWEFLQAYPYAENMLAPEYSSKALQKMMTTNMTTVVNSVAASLTKLGLDLSNVTVAGNVSISEVYVHAEWKWLVFPIALEALGILLVLSTVAVSHSRRARLWKSSVLPLLYHGLDESLVKAQNMPQDVFGMEELARKTKVRLTGPLLEDRVVLAS